MYSSRPALGDIRYKYSGQQVTEAFINDANIIVNNPIFCRHRCGAEKLICEYGNV